MNNDIAYSITTNLFVFAWILLVVGNFLPVSGVWRSRMLVTGGRVIPITLLVAFFLGFLTTLGMGGSLFTFSGVLELFGIPEKVLMIWIEILAYALLVGRWVIDHATERGVPRVLVFACLVVLFMSGGLGLLAYLVVATTVDAMRHYRREVSSD